MDGATRNGPSGHETPDDAEVPAVTRLEPRPGPEGAAVGGPDLGDGRDRGEAGCR